MAGLVDLARRPPKLGEIVVSAMDVSNVPKEAWLPRGGCQQVRKVGARCLITNRRIKVGRIAKLLDEVFPKHDEYPRIQDDREVDDEWLAVQSLMNQLRASRVRM